MSDGVSVETVDQVIQQSNAGETATLPGVETPPAEIGNSSQSASDPEAPYGRKADGTPRGKPGRKGSVEGASAAQRERLESVTPAPLRVERARPIAQAQAIPVDYEGLGRTAANLWFNVGQIPFGPDWAPNVEHGEPERVKDAFRDYFKATGVTQISPGLSLGLILGAYSLERINKPTVMGRVRGVFHWFKSKIVRVKG